MLAVVSHSGIFCSSEFAFVKHDDDLAKKMTLALASSCSSNEEETMLWLVMNL
jgi:hypothetical protein